MRALLPSPLDSVDVYDHYAANWSDSGGLRVNFISSVDGAATADGLSEGLQTPGDNLIFGVLRDLADVVLIGAGTARDEGYRPAHPSSERRAKRASLGYAEIPPIAVISRSLRLDPEGALCAGADPSARTIVITCEAGDPDVRAALASTADVIVCGEDEVDLPAAVGALRERGLTRILSEGGPTVFAEMVTAGVVDELDLTVSPMLTGPGSRRIVSGLPWQGKAPLQLFGLLEEDDALFCRYRVGWD